jgi:hypothetical protein
MTLIGLLVLVFTCLYICIGREPVIVVVVVVVVVVVQVKVVGMTEKTLSRRLHDDQK